MKKVILILSILILNSCAVNLSTAGKEIRIVSSDMKDCCCESLGIVSGSWGMGMSQGMDAESSYNQVRNDVHFSKNRLKNGFLKISPEISKKSMPFVAKLDLSKLKMEEVKNGPKVMSKKGYKIDVKKTKAISTTI